MFLTEGLRWEISLIGLALTAFTLANILTKPYKHSADWLLCVWLILLNMPFFHSVLLHLNIDASVFYLYTNPTLNLLNGPLLYLYVRMLAGNEKTGIQRSVLIHFLPFALFYFLFILMSHPEPMMPQPNNTLSDVGPVGKNSLMALLEPLITYFGFINVLSFIGYSTATIYTLNRHQKNITGIFSQNDIQISLKWIYALPGTFAMLVVFAVIFESIPMFSSLIHPVTLHMFSFLCFIVLLCFFGIKQNPVFQFRPRQLDPVEIIEEDISKEDKGVAEEPSVQVSGETESDGLGDEFVAQTVENMHSYMSNEKPFLDPDFSVYALADALNIPRRMLSQVLSAGLSKNFYQYVNEFRIEEVKSQLTYQNDKTTILDIAFQAGFKSKSSFNSLFKQHCNLTPSQYRKMIKQQNDLY